VTPHLDGDPATERGRPGEFRAPPSPDLNSLHTTPSPEGLASYEYPGGADSYPSWLGLSSAQRRLNVDDVSSRLLASRPPSVPREFEASPQVRPAAAIIPVVEHQGEAALVVTRRPATMKFHRNDWVFPGGVIDSGRDRDGEQAALRELHEELGVPPARVTVLDHLSSYGPFVTGFGLQVYVGRLAEDTPILPDANEVADVAILSVSRLSDPGTFFLSRDMPDGYEPGPTASTHIAWRSPAMLLRHFVIAPDEFLWGTQGDIVYDFLDRLFTAEIREMRASL
jgi:8-oxo-dGTP pyrophosphatase MutT (NUDIX family)